MASSVAPGWVAGRYLAGIQERSTRDRVKAQLATPQAQDAVMHLIHGLLGWKIPDGITRPAPDKEGGEGGRPSRGALPVLAVIGGVCAQDGSREGRQQRKDAAAAAAAAVAAGGDRGAAGVAGASRLHSSSSSSSSSSDEQDGFEDSRSLWIGQPLPEDMASDDDNGNGDASGGGGGGGGGSGGRGGGRRGGGRQGGGKGGRQGAKYKAQFVGHVASADTRTADMAPGERMTKRWRLQNSGDVPWPVGCTLEHVGGANLVAGAHLRCPVPVVAPGGTVDLSVQLVAPAEPGRHVAYFRLRGPDGRRFGSRIWADLSTQQAPAAPATAAAAAAAATMSATVPAAAAASRKGPPPGFAARNQ